MKQERMKDAMKDTFSKLELSENAKEEVWEQIAEKIGHSNGKKSGRIQKVLIKTAAVVLVVVLLFAGINKLSAGKLAEAVTGFWRADKNSSEIIIICFRQIDRSCYLFFRPVVNYNTKGSCKHNPLLRTFPKLRCINRIQHHMIICRFGGSAAFCRDQ